MNLQTPKPTETSFGGSHQREEILSREAHHSRIARWVRAIARVASVLSVVGLVALLLVGPGRALDWLVNYVIPVVVITGVVITSLALLVWALKGFPESTLRDWYRTYRYH
jgi:hypothetical protein